MCGDETEVDFPTYTVNADGKQLTNVSVSDLLSVLAGVFITDPEIVYIEQYDGEADQ